MAAPAEIEFIFEPDSDGGFHAYAPELPGLHTQGDTLEEAMVNAQEALDLYVDGLREEGRSLDMVVPLHRELKRATLAGILRDAGLDAAELRELLSS